MVGSGSRTVGNEAPAEASDPLIGRRIGGRFRILDLLARGGMGKVYRAEQEPLGRLCAVKVLHPRQEGDDPEFQRRFLLEAATAAQLSHPNTVTIFDYGRDGDVYYIAMEYIQGRTLYRVLREDGPLEEPRVVRILSQVCRSLREAHQLGVIHRDMKPGNLVLVDTADEADTVKVLDFGLVKRVDGQDREDLTQEGMFMGSPKYMAPEQILDNPVSPATDVYALGVVAYELACGKPPFDEGTSVKTMMAHLHLPLPSLRERMGPRPLSAEFEAVVRRCLAREPAERFESMEALLRALQLLDGVPLTDSLGGPRVWAMTATGRERLQPSVAVRADAVPPPAVGGDVNDTLVTGPPAHLEERAGSAAGPSGGAPPFAGAAGDRAGTTGDTGRHRELPRRIAVGLVGIASVSLGALLAVGIGAGDDAGAEHRGAPSANRQDGSASVASSRAPTDAGTTTPAGSSASAHEGHGEPPPQGSAGGKVTTPAAGPGGAPSTAASATTGGPPRKGDTPHGYKQSPY